MLSHTPGLTEALDADLVGFLTAVNAKGQPQTSPIWFIRDGDDIVIYNRARAARLRSIAENSRVAFNLHADAEGRSGISLEGTAAVESSLPPAEEFPGYVDKYDQAIADLGMTPKSFSDDYSVGIRMAVKRVRAWRVDRLIEG